MQSRSFPVGLRITEMVGVDMKFFKRCFLGICIIALLLQTVVSAFNVEKVIGIDINSETFCNAFIRAADKVFYSDIYNKTLKSKTLELEEKVTDHTGAIVWSDNKAITINAKSRILEAVVPEVNNNGLYTLEMTLKQNGTVCDVFNGEFTVTEGKRTTDDVGVCTHLYLYGDKKIVSLLKNLGFSMIRDEAMWDFVENSRGQYKIPDRVQSYVEYANQKNLDILMPLTYGNHLYMSNTSQMPYTDEQINAYVNYCKFVVSHFRDEVKYFEIWNEPNITAFNPENRTAADYTKLLKAAYEGIKSVNPNAVVIGGVCATPDNVHEYYESLNSVGAYNYMDAISIHLYSCFGTNPIGEGNREFEWVVNMLEKYNKPIWVSEVGYYSSPKFSEEEQAAYEARTAVLYKANGKIDKVFFYDLQDDGNDASNAEHNFGMITSDLRAKPNFASVAAAVHFTGNAEIKETKQANEYSLFKFRNDTENEDIYALWTKGGRSINANITYGNAFEAELSGNNLNITLPQTDKNLYYADCFGKETQVQNGYNFTLDYKPAYIICR